jgi:hypothetical protein
MTQPHRIQLGDVWMDLRRVDDVIEAVVHAKLTKLTPCVQLTPAQLRQLMSWQRVEVSVGTRTVGIDHEAHELNVFGIAGLPMQTGDWIEFVRAVRAAWDGDPFSVVQHQS